MKFGDSIYYCKKIPGEVDKYEKPIKIVLQPNYFTIMPTRGFSDIQVYGKEVVNYYTAYARLSKWGKDMFTDGSRFYVDYKEPSQDEEDFGDKANAYIDGDPLFDNLWIKIMIKKLVV